MGGDILSSYSVRLMAKVSEFYYKHGMTQQKIADRLKISRVKVSRILSAARKEGIIDIKVNYPQKNWIEVEKQLEQLFELKEAKVIGEKNDSEEVCFNKVAKSAAQYLVEKIEDGDTLGISWGETLREVVNSVSPYEKKIRIVQILGSLGSQEVSANKITHKLSEAFIGESYHFPAPAIVDNKEIKEAILSDGEINDLFKIIGEITMAVVGIGDISKESTFVSSGYLSEQDLKQLKKSGAVGDMCARFFNKEGEQCNTVFNQRVIGITMEQLRKIPYVIGVVSGTRKAEAILGALNTGAIDVLISDITTVSKVLELARKDKS